MTMVVDLRNPKHYLSFSCEPHLAVIAAFAQDNMDWNTWDYLSRYSDRLVYGQYSVSCGDYCALLEEQENG